MIELYAWVIFGVGCLGLLWAVVRAVAEERGSGPALASSLVGFGLGLPVYGRVFGWW